MPSLRDSVVFSVWLALFYLVGVPTASAVMPGDGRPAPQMVRGHNYNTSELLVKFRSTASSAQIQSLGTDIGAVDVQSFRRSARLRQGPIDQWRLVKLGAGVDQARARATLLRNRMVDRVEYNYEVRVMLTPNDPGFDYLWGMNNVGQTGGKVDGDIDATEAWDMHTGNGNVVVAVIDTGVAYSHADLAANMWVNTGEIPGNGIDDDGNGYVDDVYGYNFVNNTGNPQDDHGHGTHCAGTIAAVGNNGIGVAGVTWRARIMAVKFLDASGSGTTTGAISSVLYAASNGAQVMSNSWGGGGFSQALLDAITTADQAGALFVAAAGNNGTDTDVSPNYPSNYNVPNVMSIAATDHLDLKASFSNYGLTTVDLGAPGVSIYSTVPLTGNACCSNPSGYHYLSGTSMATPHVSGAAALIFSQYPGITHYQVRDRLLFRTDQVASLTGITVTGGRLNIARAIAQQEAIPPAPVIDLATTTIGSSSVTLRWSATGDDGYAGNASAYDLRYSYGPIDEINFNQATPAVGEPSPAAPGTLETFTVQGLVADTNYYFALRVIDDVGNASTLSNVVSARTKAVRILFQDNMESGPTNWTVAGSDGIGGPALWHLSTHRFNSPSTAMYYGIESTLNFNTGARNFGSITSVPINLVGETDATLTFTHFLQTENFSPYDTARVQVSSNNGSTWTDLYVTALSTNGMVTYNASLSAYDGQVILLRFSFDTFDALFNGFEGWVVDDVAVSVTQNARAPIANAGGPYSGNKKQLITFNGYGSSDPDGDPLTYVWNFGDGTGGVGPNPTHAYANAGNYTVTLVVNDGALDSSPATAPVLVFNQGPIANAGGPYSGYRNQAVSFDGTGSKDADGDPLTYSWNFGDGSTGTGATPSHAYANSGSYTVTLLVHDGFVGSTSSTATVSIQNRAPVANAGGPYTGNRNVPIAFAGSGTDPDGDALSYGWSFGDGTTGTGPTPTHSYSALGSYSAVLVASDGEASSSPATATVTILNLPPVAAAGPDQTVKKGATVRLNGTSSNDPDGTITGYRWRQVSGPSVQLRNTTSAIADFRAPEPKSSSPIQLVFELRVTDNDGAIATDQVTVTVTR